MTKLTIGIAIGIGVLGSGCDKGGKKSVGPEICSVVAAKIKTCAEPFWTRMGQEPEGGLGRKAYEGNEQKMCEDQFAIREAQGERFDSCMKTDDCKAWADCAVPAFWKAKK